jgi:hypothetical protein
VSLPLCVATGRTGRAACWRDAAKNAFSEADTPALKELTAAITSAKDELNSEMRKIFGDEHPEVLDWLQPVLDTFAANLYRKANAGSSELLAKAAKPFDRTEPTSPMARHAAELMVSREQLAAQPDKNHTDLVSKVQELSAAVKIHDAKTSLAEVTPIKGASYEGEIHILMLDIAAGLGDEYSDTGPNGRMQDIPAIRERRTIQIRNQLSALAATMPSVVRLGGPLAIQIEGNHGRCRAGV